VPLHPLGSSREGFFGDAYPRRAGRCVGVLTAARDSLRLGDATSGTRIHSLVCWHHKAGPTRRPGPDVVVPKRWFCRLIRIVVVVHRRGRTGMRMPDPIHPTGIGSVTLRDERSKLGAIQAGDVALRR